MNLNVYFLLQALSIIYVNQFQIAPHIVIKVSETAENSDPKVCLDWGGSSCFSTPVYYTYYRSDMFVTVREHTKRGRHIQSTDPYILPIEVLNYSYYVV